MSQRELVERARRGDADAFDLLVASSIRKVDAAARLILRDPHLAEDAVQEAYGRAWRDLPALRDPDRFDGWLYRLVVRACYDEIRRRRHVRIEVELTVELAAPMADPSGPVADRLALDDAMRTLDVDLRSIVVLHYYLDVPLPDAARALGIPTGTAKSRLFRAREHLRVALEGTGAAHALRFEERPA